MQTEFDFRLPRGYRAPDGTLFRDGTLRLATAGDEISVLGDPRVKTNRVYAVVLLFSKIITELGPLRGDDVTPEVVEGLFASDLAYLQDFYRDVASDGATREAGPPDA